MPYQQGTDGPIAWTATEVFVAHTVADARKIDALPTETPTSTTLTALSAFDSLHPTPAKNQPPGTGTAAGTAAEGPNPILILTGVSAAYDQSAWKIFVFDPSSTATDDDGTKVIQPGHDASTSVPVGRYTAARTTGRWVCNGT